MTWMNELQNYTFSSLGRGVYGGSIGLLRQERCKLVEDGRREPIRDPILEFPSDLACVKNSSFDASDIVNDGLLLVSADFNNSISPLISAL